MSMRWREMVLGALAAASSLAAIAPARACGRTTDCNIGDCTLGERS